MCLNFDNPPIVRGHYGSCGIVLFLWLFLSFFIGCSVNQDSEANAKSDHADSQAIREKYVGAAICAECHSEAHEKWKESHHFHAMELPNDETVRADFNNSLFENFGIKTKFYREGDKYMVETENEKGDASL